MDLQIRNFGAADTEPVVKLWRECGLVVPWNDPYRDIERKIQVQPELFLVGCLDAQVIASAMAGYEGHRGWINYLAVAPACQGCNYGRRMMEEAEVLLRALGCPKINLQVRTGNLSVIKFYHSIGYKTDDVVSMGKRLIPDT